MAHGARENADTRLAVGCCADGRRGRAHRITTDACGAAQVGGIGYELTMPDGSVRTGTAGPDGVIKLTQLTLRGDCKIVFRSIDDQTKGWRQHTCHGPDGAGCVQLGP